MATQNELFDATEVALINPAGPAFEYWIVLGFYSVGPWWKMFKDLFTTKEAAAKFAEQLPKHYTQRYVFRISNKVE